MPLDEVIIYPLSAILANKFNSGDHATLLSLLMEKSTCKILIVAVVRGVQVIASLEVYIADPVISDNKTSTSNESSGDQTISCKAIEGAPTTYAQSIPLDEVIILLPEVLILILINRFNSATKIIFFQFPVGIVLLFQVETALSMYVLNYKLGCFYWEL